MNNRNPARTDEVRTGYYVCHSPHVSWRRIADHVLIIDHKNRQLLTLNDVAGTIWEHADCWQHVDCLIHTIEDIYDIDHETAEQDVKIFIQEFLTQSLLVSDNTSLRSRPKKDNVVLQYFGDDIPVGLRSMCVRNNIPIVGCLEITERCNLRCQHCYNSPKTNPELSLSEMKSVVDHLAMLGCLDLLITGGEPTVHPDFSDIVWYARQRKFSVTIKTNATQVDDTIAQLLRKAFVNEVHVSVYSILPEEHEAITGIPGSLNKTIRGIQNLTNAGVPVQIACPLTKINYRSVRQLKDWASTAGIKCAFDPMITARVDGDRSPVNLRLGRAEIDELYDSGTYSAVIFPHMINTSDASPTALATFSPEQQTLPICGAGSSMVFITAYGDVIPCVALPINAGNVRDKPLEDIWRDSAILNEVRALTFAKFTECMACDKLEYCTRCPGVFYSDTGNVLTPSPGICLLASYAQRTMKGGEAND